MAAEEALGGSFVSSSRALLNAECLVDVGVSY